MKNKNNNKKEIYFFKEERILVFSGNVHYVHSTLLFLQMCVKQSTTRIRKQLHVCWHARGCILNILKIQQTLACQRKALFHHKKILNYSLFYLLKGRKLSLAQFISQGMSVSRTLKKYFKNRVLDSSRHFSTGSMALDWNFHHTSHWAAFDWNIHLFSFGFIVALVLHRNHQL